jgi:hypothetical protein
MWTTKKRKMNNVTYFHECYGMLLILKMLQRTANKFTINYVKKQGKIEHHQELHKFKKKKNHHEHHKKE